MRFGVLGPLQVADDQGRELSLGGPKQRAVLAILLSHAGEVLPSDRLIDLLWGERPPASAAKTVQVYVSKLRKVLGEGVIITGSGGYVLRAEPGEIDLGRFRALAGEGRLALQAGECRRAVRTLREALALWRGAPLADLGYEQFAQGEIARLEDLRLVALEDCFEAELELGEHAVGGELEALVRQHPLRERLRGQLMLALYREGRQTEALATYRELSELLRDELGLEPGESLRELERLILRHDPALSPARPEPAAAAADLPAPPSAFLGRSRELSELAALLHSPDTRLLTLTGAGGTGKTRLALRLAETCAREYRDGAVFVGLAEVTATELMPSTITRALGLADTPNSTPMQRLREWARERRLLLLLDNFEQLADGSATLAELLAACPGITALVTSREPLRLSGERQYEVPVLEPSEAIALFATRAEAVAPGVSIDPALAGAICDRVDHLPLAIELAAARVKALSLEQILTRLDRSLALLTGGPRDAPRRQRTIRATIDWSHGLLHAEEQRLFARLAVFSGGCPLSAAQSICAAELDALQSLVDRSLLRHDAGRYRMLQTLREYALERLQDSGEEQALRRAHADWLIALLERERLQQPGWPNGRSLKEVSPELENFRSALDWALRGDLFEILGRLAAPLVGVWVMTGQLQEATRWMAIVLEHNDRYDGRLAAQVLSAARALAWERGDHATASALSARALTLWSELGDPGAFGIEIVSGGIAAAAAGETERGRAAFEHAVAFASDHGLHDIRAAALNNLGDLAIAAGRLDEGRSFCERSCEASGRAAVIARAPLMNLGHIAMLEGNPGEAIGFGCEALELALGCGDLIGVASAGIGLSWPLAHVGDVERAARLFGAAVGFIERAGAHREWMDESSEATVRAILRERLDEHRALTLIDEGRHASLEAVARDALDAASALALTG
jgi:predicted ATPase/DNA-binding SARP family transcriptional activator